MLISGLFVGVALSWLSATNAVFTLPSIDVDRPATTALPRGGEMIEGGREIAPMSFVAFCLTYPADCRDGGGRAPLPLTAARFAELEAVNLDVNRRIRPQVDRTPMRLWHLNVGAGDCNTYAVQKRHDLLQRGWPASALLLTVARTAGGEGHLVLTVRTDRGDLVLDNLNQRIVPVDATDYRWIMRQSAARTDQWVTVRVSTDGAPSNGHDLAASKTPRGGKVAMARVKTMPAPAPRLALARPQADRLAPSRQIGWPADEVSAAEARTSASPIGQL